MKFSQFTFQIVMDHILLCYKFISVVMGHISFVTSLQTRYLDFGLIAIDHNCFIMNTLLRTCFHMIQV